MSDPIEPKKYSLKLKSLPLVIEDEHGLEQTYTLKELTGLQRDEFVNKTTARATDAKGKEKRHDAKGLASDLLGMCLYDAQNRLVPANVINGWPSEMQQDIFLEAVELSGLTKKAEGYAKND